MRPSTVHTSRFSFFSREVIFAFAPWSTASTCAIESFQRKPKGGTSSSTEYAPAADRKRQTTPIERIRHIATPLRGRMYFACQFFIFVWIARIFDRHPNSIVEAEKLRARYNSVKSRRPAAAVSISGPLCRAKTGQRNSFVSHGHVRFPFLVKKNFCSL